MLMTLYPVFVLAKDRGPSSILIAEGDKIEQMKVWKFMVVMIVLNKNHRLTKSISFMNGWSKA